MSARKRGTNFSNTEKLLLIEIITQYKDIIENKKTDAVCSTEKRKCWDEISHRFNSESNVFRDVLILKNCWENLKKRTRKYYAEERCNLYKTDGGPNETQHDPIMEKIYCIIQPSVDGLNNEFDSDNIENNMYSYQKSNSNSDCNPISMGELLEEHILSDEEEDGMMNYIDTMQNTSSSYAIGANIDKDNCVDMKRNVFNKEISIKQNIAKGVKYKSQVQSMYNFNKINACKENNSERPESRVTHEQLHDITNYNISSRENTTTDSNDSTTIQEKVPNTKVKIKENISVGNMLKKMSQSQERHKENMSLKDDHGRTFHNKRVASISQKVLKTCR